MSLFSKFIVGVSLLFVPAFASASVYISEIAWMGSNNGGTATQNANDEWVELYNDSSAAVTIEGWTFNLGDKAITLQGSIKASGYYLLERTDDGSVPGISADLIYSGSLSNGGMTLSLKDLSGGVIDTVVGGENWQNIGGNNETKETPQRRGAVWVVASPTPKSAPSGQAQSTPAPPAPADNTEENSSANNTSTSSNSAPVSFGYAPLTSRVTAKAYGPSHAIAGADVVFEGKAYGMQGETLPQARYFWNFGDGGTSSYQKTTHSYMYPGEYVVMLSVVSGEDSATSRLAVTVSPASLSISRVEEGDSGFIELSNRSQEELSLSFWILEVGGRRFAIPEYTVILPSRTLVFPYATTGLKAAIGIPVRLLYPSGSPAYEYQWLKSIAKEEEVNEIKVAVNDTKIEDVGSWVGPIVKKEEMNDSEEVLSFLADTEVAAAVKSLPASSSRQSLIWLGGIGAIIIVSALGIMIHRRQKEGEIKIIE